MTNSLKFKVVLLIVFFFLAGLGWQLYSRHGLALSSDARVTTVKRDILVQTITIPGAVEPVRTTTILPPYEGYVTKIYVKTGQNISAGDPVASVSQSPEARGEVFPIRSPFTGKVVQVQKSQGQYVKPGDAKEYIVRIDDFSKLFVYSNVPELEVPKIKIGQEAVIKASPILSRTYKGVVREISEAPNWRESWGRSQVEYQVKIELLDFDKQLMPGMSTLVDIVANQKENILILPHEFLHREKDQMFVVLKDGKRKNVKIGLQNESIAEIVEGLNEGEEVRQVDFVKLLQSDAS